MFGASVASDLPGLDGAHASLNGHTGDQVARKGQEALVARVIAGMTISLDGFVAITDPDGNTLVFAAALPSGS